MRVTLSVWCVACCTCSRKGKAKERYPVARKQGRFSVPAALPLAPQRSGRTATRPRAFQHGTLDIEWQCTELRPVRSPPSGSVGRTATRPRAYRSHCHSAPSVPTRYARHRVAVYGALPLAPERSILYVHPRLAVYDALSSTLGGPFGLFRAPPGSTLGLSRQFLAPCYTERDYVRHVTGGRSPCLGATAS